MHKFGGGGGGGGVAAVAAAVIFKTVLVIFLNDYHPMVSFKDQLKFQFSNLC